MSVSLTPTDNTPLPSAISVMPAEVQLADEIGQCYADPLRYVLTVFPWGQEGTPLADYRGPDDWQTDFLIELGEQVRDRNFDGRNSVMPIMFSTASGHGIGKSTLVAMLLKWLLDTRPYCKGVLTATTFHQLKTKTWAEFMKWHKMSLTEHWYRATSGASLSLAHTSAAEFWRVDAITCDESQSDSFAGQHSASSSSFYIFDEASGVPDMLFEVRAGGITDGEAFVFDFGNPIRSSGRFYENMMGQFKHRYIRRFIDARTSGITNKQYLNDLLQDWGDDSDFARVRIKGEFPRAGNRQLIATDHVEKCADEEIFTTLYDPLIMGVDVASFGDDDSVICLRQGRNVREIISPATPHMDFPLPTFQVYKKQDIPTIARHVINTHNKYQPTAVVIDATGIGRGVYDLVRAAGIKTFKYDGSSSPNNSDKYANKRAEIWGEMAIAIEEGLALPRPDAALQDRDVGGLLKAELIAMEYGINKRGRMQLESKEDMKKRGLRSPNLADALSMTFLMPFLPRMKPIPAGNGRASNHESDFDPYDDERVFDFKR